MFESLSLGRVFGIRIQINVLSLALGAFAFLMGGWATLLLFVLLYSLVLLHELGHALVAQHFGIRVHDITLWPLGGMARMEEIPEVPRVEGWIAVAGPAVNFGLALIALPFVAANGFDLQPLGTYEAITPSVILGLFFFMNISLGGFNLVPAFPMDGGRVLRSLLARKIDWVRATEIAVRVGRFAAFGMILGGLFYGFWFLPLIGLFIWIVGARELFFVRLRHGQSPFGGAFRVNVQGFPGFPGFTPPGGPQAGGTEPLDPEAPLFGERAADGSAPTGQPPRPADTQDAAPSVSIETPADTGGGGFSTTDLEQLERFRGSIRPRDPGPS